jgi:hypothetical protein
VYKSVSTQTAQTNDTALFVCRKQQPLGQSRNSPPPKKLKVKFTLEQATKVQRGEYGYSSALSLTSVLEAGRW